MRGFFSDFLFFFGQPRSSSSLLSLKDIVDKGELTVSLKYQILTNKVTVVIMKAMNLPNISKIFAIGEFCLRIFFLFYLTHRFLKNKLVYLLHIKF